MAKSRHQSQNDIKIIGIQNRISDEKVRQEEYKLKFESERTQQENLRFQQSQGDTQIERHKLEGKRADVESARYEAESRKVGAKKSQTRLGMAQDELKALTVERQIKQKMLAESLNSLQLQASQMREDNRLKLEELKALYSHVPSLKSGV